MGVDPSWMGLVPLYKGHQNAPSILLSCEYRGRSWPSVNQEADVKFASALILDFQAPEL